MVGPRLAARWAPLLLLVLLSLVRFAHETERLRENGFYDFEIFWGQAQEFVETGRLYPGTADLQRYYPTAAVFKFPPLYMVPLVPLVRLGVGDAIFTWHWALQILLYLTALQLCMRAVRPARPLAYGLTLAVLALNFEPFFETLSGLQLETVLLALIAGCLLFVARGSDRIAGLALSAAAMLKIYPAFLGLYFLVRRRWAAIAWCASGCLVLLLLSAAVIGPGETRVFFLRLLPFMLAENPDATTENLGFGRHLQTLLGMSPDVARLVSRAISTPLVLVTSWLAYRSRLDAREGALLGFAVFPPLMLLSMPNPWANYQLLLLVPFAVLLDYVFRRGRKWGTVLALAAPAFVLALVTENHPRLLSVITLPESIHAAAVNAKILTTLFVWLAAVIALSATQPRDSRAVRVARRPDAAAGSARRLPNGPRSPGSAIVRVPLPSTGSPREEEHPPWLCGSAVPTEK